MTSEDRLRIKDGLEAGLTKSAIADKLGFNKSTIGREITRNKGLKGYRPKQAQAFAEAREESKHGPYKMNPVLMSQIIERLELKWSPEQISNRLRVEGHETVSAETIYKFIYEDRENDGELWRHLRRSHRTRKKRFPSEDRRGKIQKARSISKRSKKANKRKKLGHWERDLMVGKNHKSAVLVITDRKSRFNKFRKLNHKSAKKVTKETITALRDLPKKTMTNDRGQEFSDHKSYEKRTKIKVYFCEPYSSYQRGTNENRIGILRQYYPKKTDLTNLTNRELEIVEFEINNRPMKILDWMTPYEVMMGKSCTGKL
ncbi:MAG: IS30 family transposase [Cytophagales bacterium]